MISPRTDKVEESTSPQQEKSIKSRSRYSIIHYVGIFNNHTPTMLQITMCLIFQKKNSPRLLRFSFFIDVYISGLKFQIYDIYKQ